MRINKFDTDCDVLVIAEIGNNHEGSYSLAEELIGKAVEAGAGAVKFQTFLTEQYISPAQKDRYERLKKFQLSYEQFERLAAYSHKVGILFISTAFDLESARFLGSIVDAMKIASADNIFFPLIEQIAKAGKPTILSTGLAGGEEIHLATSFIRNTWYKTGVEQDLAILHCVSSYPTPLNQVNLSAIKTLINEFNCTVGYSDHVIGNDAAIMAVVAGARIIEKHFTIDNNYSDFRDHKLSANPETMADLVNRIKEIKEIMGDGKLGAADCEKEGVVPLRRSIAAVKNLKKGTTIKIKDLTWLRPGGYLSPDDNERILGRILKKDLDQGDLITEDLVE